MAGLDLDLVGRLIAASPSVPGALAWALAGGLAAGRVRRRRRRREIDLALHELRRPLQALLLQPGARPAHRRHELTSIDLALAAVNDLEAVLDGARRARIGTGSRPVAGPGHGWNRLLADAADRWQQAAWLAGVRIEIDSAADDRVEIDRAAAVELARALDNLILNALIHGGGDIRLCAVQRSGDVEVRVCDRGARDRRASLAAPSARRPRAGRERRRRRHGHGLRAVREIVAAQGGSFQLRRGEEGATAILRLPALRDAR